MHRRPAHSDGLLLRQVLSSHAKGEQDTAQHEHCSTRPQHLELVPMIAHRLLADGGACCAVQVDGECLAQLVCSMITADSELGWIM
jgi:hypothetical protein